MRPRGRLGHSHRDLRLYRAGDHDAPPSCCGR